MEEKQKKSRAAYHNSWIAENMDRIYLTVQKGRKKELSDHAAARGESLNRFINRAIENQLKNDKAGE